MKPIFIYSDKFLDGISWFMRVGGISIFPIVVLREKHKDPKTAVRFVKSATTHRHETIHFRQQLEMLVIPFYVWYVVEFLVKLIRYGKNRGEMIYKISNEKKEVDVDVVSGIVDDVISEYVNCYSTMQLKIVNNYSIFMSSKNKNIFEKIMHFIC